MDDSVFEFNYNVEGEVASITDEIKEAFDRFRSNPVNSILLTLQAKVDDINPIRELINKIGLSLNIDTINIEKLLDKLDFKY
jgi:hypothetical protein